jgi:hypothetical protein
MAAGLKAELRAKGMASVSIQAGMDKNISL